MKKILLLFIALITLSNLFSYSSNEINMLFKQANEFFKKGSYSDALKLYKTIEEESNDPNLLYNMGNCYAQLDEKGRAILYYKRSLLSDSANSSAREALASLESDIIAVQSNSGSFVGKLALNCYNFLSLNNLAIINIMLFIILGILAFLFLSNVIAISLLAKRFYTSLTLFVVFFFLIISIYKYYSYSTNQQIVIVGRETTIYKEEENRVFATKKRLKPGMTLEYITEQGKYALVSLPNGEKILLPKEAFEFIK